MKIAQYKHYIKNKDGETRKESLNIANALFAELLNYGIVADDEVINRISRLKPKKALKVSKEIADEYVAPNLNAPLFKNWEERTYFSLGEFVIQIYGYVFQFSGNDLNSDAFRSKLKKNIDVAPITTLPVPNA
jgi:hypothetical protein